MKKNLLVLLIICMITEGCLKTDLSGSKDEKSMRCTSPPKDFSELDLVGTWIAGWPGHTDTLIIKAGETYKQVVHVEFVNKPPIDYESDWQPWHLEFSEDNIPYLHLDNMRFCGMNPEISCEKRTGGGYDFCRDTSMKMVNEGILLVLTTSEEQGPGADVPQRYIYLHYPLGSENSWVYTKK